MQTRTRRSSSIVGVVAVTASLLAVPSWASPAAAAKTVSKRPAVHKTPALPAHHASARRLNRPKPQPSTPIQATAWPAARTVSVSVTRPAEMASSQRVAATGLPVSIAASGTPTRTAQPNHLGITAAAPATARQAGVLGTVLKVTRQAASADAITLRLSYHDFASAAGGDYGRRLRFVQLPSCALTTPTKPACQVQTPLTSVNDGAGQTVTTELAPSLSTAARPSTSGAGRRSAALSSAQSSQAVVAATAGPSSSAGDFTASSLAPSGSWTAGGSTGAYTWSYPITAPAPAAGSDVAPSVALGYNSQTVDGKIPTTNNQDSWVGQGFDYSPGFIERSFKPCTEEPNITKVKSIANGTIGDQCWAGDVLNFSLNGSSNAIVRDTSSGIYRLQHDDGSRIELLGSGTSQYWRVTDTSGVQYFFGLATLPGGQATGSAWTVPVCGDATTTCSASGTSTITPIANQIWRWNLAYVVDPHNNATGYRYGYETNYYTAGGSTAGKLMSYIRGGFLYEIDYGMVAGSSSLTTPAQKLVFTVDNRCLSDCSTFDASHYPDSPTDQRCASSGTCNNYAPTFWSQKRLVAITTEYYSGSGSTYYLVDQYKLTQAFPSGDSYELELSSIVRTGYAAKTAFTIPSTTPAIPAASSGGTTLPTVSFTYSNFNNHVSGVNSQPDLYLDRMHTITAETGQSIVLYYNQSGRVPATCTSSSVPTATNSDVSGNTRECFPVKWYPTGYDPSSDKPILDWFHTYLVTAVAVNDLNSTGANKNYIYYYNGSPAWHYDDNEVARPVNRTYGQFRGYGSVTTWTGNPSHTLNGVTDAWTRTTTTYYRGMGGTPFGSGAPDNDEYAGSVRETQTYVGTSGPEVSAVTTTMTTPATSPTATRARTAPLSDLKSTMARVQSTRTDTDLASGGVRSETVTNNYDGLGRLTRTEDTGSDVAAKCTVTDWADNSTNWIRDLPAGVTIAAQSCPANNGALTSSNILSAARTLYDGSSSYGAIPGAGDPTDVQRETDVATGHWSRAATAYDSLGRPTSDTVMPDSNSANNRTTTTAYTPSDGNPTTSITTTTPLGTAHQAVTTIDPSRGSVLSSRGEDGLTTSAAYDALGRLTSVWKPGHPTSGKASVTYSYVYGPSAPLAVTTNTLVDQGNNITPTYDTAVSIYDAFGQLRQTQTAAVGGGRNISDSFVDGHGWVVATNSPWHTTNNPTTTIVTTPQSGIDDSYRTVYDAAGRATSVSRYTGTTQTSTTTSTYSGDSVTVDPPTGAVETTTHTDARGNTTELDQWKTAPTISNNVVSGGSAVRTTYSYDALSRQDGITQAAGTSVAASWSTTFDTGGRVVRAVDPDTGTTTSTYDDTDDLLSASAATTLSYSYDQLGRKTAEYNTGVSGQSSSTKIASWAYDSLLAGHPTSSTRYDAGNTYTRATTGYDDTGMPTGSTLTMSNPPAGFDSTYTESQTWSTTGLQLTDTPAQGASRATTGGLFPETLTRTYDAFGDPTSTSSGDGDYVSNSSYTAFGEPNQYSVGVNNQAAWLTYAYDAQTHRVTDVHFSAQQADPQLEDISYAYDQPGNLIRSTDVEGGSGAPTEIQCYSYSTLDQLTAARTSTASDNCTTDLSQSGATNATVAGPQPYWRTWIYDDAGARLTQVDHAVSGGATTSATTSYTNGISGHAHALASATTGSATTSYRYDADGNTSQESDPSRTLTLSYTAEGQTKTATATGSAGGSVSYLYDADGNQLLRTDNPAGGPATTTLFLGDEELASTNGTITGTRYYTHNGTTIAVRVGASNPYDLITDPHGTVEDAAYTTQTGVNTPTRRHFDPFGNLLTDTASGGTVTGGTWPDQHAFLNKPRDPITALGDIGARSYDAVAGRFLAVDPVLTASDPQSLNGYAYGDNNPTDNSDPSGDTNVHDSDGPSGYGNSAGPPGTPDRPASGGSPVASGAPANQSIDLSNGILPGDTDANDLKQRFESGASATNPSDYWDPNDSGVGMTCFGMWACGQAFSILAHGGSVAAAKHAAAYFCIEHASACSHDAAATQELSVALQTLLVVAAGGGDADSDPATSGGDENGDSAPSLKDIPYIGESQTQALTRLADNAAADSADGASVDIGHSGIHQFPGTKVGKSQFFDNENLGRLSNTDSATGVLQKNGNTRFVMRGSHDIGVERTTGLPTDIYTVIRKPDGSVLTMFPGTSPKS